MRSLLLLDSKQRGHVSSAVLDSSTRQALGEDALV